MQPVKRVLIHQKPRRCLNIANNIPQGTLGVLAVDFSVVNAVEATISRMRALHPAAKSVVAVSDLQIPKTNPVVVVQAIRELLVSR